MRGAARGRTLDGDVVTDRALWRETAARRPRAYQSQAVRTVSCVTEGRPPRCTPERTGHALSRDAKAGSSGAIMTDRGIPRGRRKRHIRSTVVELPSWLEP